MQIPDFDESSPAGHFRLKFTSPEDCAFLFCVQINILFLGGNIAELKV